MEEIMNVVGGVICKELVSYAVILSIRKILLTLWYQFNKAADTTTHCGLLSIDTCNAG